MSGLLSAGEPLEQAGAVLDGRHAPPEDCRDQCPGLPVGDHLKELPVLLGSPFRTLLVLGWRHGRQVSGTSDFDARRCCCLHQRAQSAPANLRSRLCAVGLAHSGAHAQKQVNSHNGRSERPSGLERAAPECLGVRGHNLNTLLGRRARLRVEIDNGLRRSALSWLKSPNLCFACDR